MLLAAIVGLIVFLITLIVKGFEVALRWGLIVFAVLAIIFFFADVSINGKTY